MGIVPTRPATGPSTGRYLRFVVVLRDAEPGYDDAGSPLRGPLLRRILGKALIDRFCPFGRPLCEEKPVGGGRPPPPQDLCRLAEACPYGVLFAAALSPRPPYALFVPPSTGEGGGVGEASGSGEVTSAGAAAGTSAADRAAGGAHVETSAGAAAGTSAAERTAVPARVEITLFGPAWPLYPWALAALAAGLRAGVGKERCPFVVEKVDRIHPDRRPRRLAGGDLADLPAALAPDLLNLALEPDLPPQPVTVRFLSPARLLRDGRLLPGREPVPFALLIARILDRFAGLYGPGASDCLRPEIRQAIEAEAAGVPVVEDDTRWVEVQDYSARSRSELLMGGKVGRAVYGEGAARFLPLLRAGEILHVGKNAASGCGRIQVDLAQAAGL